MMDEPVEIKLELEPECELHIFTDENKEGELIEKRIIRRQCTFLQEWLLDPLFRDWIDKVEDDPYIAKCVICPSTISVVTEGVGAIRRHMNSKKHQLRHFSFQLDKEKDYITLDENEIVEGTSKKTAKVSRDTEMVASEVGLVYHAVFHHHSYLSLQCGMKLSRKIFDDKLTCGRTKAESIVEKVLGPYSVQQHLNQVGGKPFSVATSASVKGHVKCMPVIVRYFSETKGIKDFLIDFVEDSYETVEALGGKILSVLHENNLYSYQLKAYSSDTALVNYETHQRVYQNLQHQIPRLIEANCNCHVLHNMAKFACKFLFHDVETFIIKVFNELSSANYSEQLKDCFEFIHNDYSNMLKNLPNKWLGLLQGIDKLIKNWDAIKMYFFMQGKDNTLPLICEFICSSIDIEHATETASIGECILLFMQNYLTLVNTAAKSFESSDAQPTEVYPIMDHLRKSLKNRLKDKFFGFKVNLNLKKMAPDDVHAFQMEAFNVYERSISYLEIWFDFEASPFKFCATLGLKRDITFNELIECAQRMNTAVDGDKLYEEYLILKEALPSLINVNTKADTKWINFFNAHPFLCPNLKLVVDSVFCIPVNNNHIEKVLSIMNNLWQDDRNRMRLDLVKSELLVKFNYGMPCSEFSTYLLQDEQRPLLVAAKSSKKYSFESKSKKIKTEPLVE